jgi:hypothetical protein
LVSRSAVDASLDDILAATHSINVHLSEEEIGTYVACGELGGTVVDGELIVGLRPLNGSGLAGVAILGGDDDDDQTDVTIYLAPVGDGAAAPVEESEFQTAPAPAATVPADESATAPAATGPAGGEEEEDGDG